MVQVDDDIEDDFEEDLDESNSGACLDLMCIPPLQCASMSIRAFALSNRARARPPLGWKRASSVHHTREPLTCHKYLHLRTLPRATVVVAISNAK